MDDAAPALRLNRTPQTLERLVYPWRAVGTGSDVGHHPGLNDLLPECCIQQGLRLRIRYAQQAIVVANHEVTGLDHHADRKSTRLNSSHLVISYAVFCLKKKKTKKR